MTVNVGLKNIHIGNKLKWLLKQGGGHILESCDISLKITPTLPSTQSNPIYVCMQLFFNAPFFIYVIAANSVCLHLLVPPLVQCCFFLLNITACTVAKIGGHTIKRTAPFATTLFKKGGWAYFRGWAYFWEITVLPNNHILCNTRFLLYSTNQHCFLLHLIAYQLLEYDFSFTKHVFAWYVNLLDHAMK